MTTIERMEKFRRETALEADSNQRPIIEDLRAGIPQKDIARKHGLSKGRISQIKKRAVDRGLLDE